MIDNNPNPSGHANPELPTKWGFCFSGNEETFCQAIRDTVEGRDWSYLEIGVGNGDCLKAVADYMTSLGVESWRIHGVDLAGLAGPAIETSTYAPHSFTIRRRSCAMHVPPKSINLYLTSAAVFLAGNKMQFDMAFIDGCHGAPCVRADFFGVEPLIRKGGIVCFHDTSQSCQGQHMQAHCGTGIDARHAVTELGLLDDTRPGWVKAYETHGEPSKGGHGSLWVKRV